MSFKNYFYLQKRNYSEYAGSVLSGDRITEEVYIKRLMGPAARENKYYPRRLRQNIFSTHIDEAEQRSWDDPETILQAAALASFTFFNVQRRTQTSN